MRLFDAGGIVASPIDDGQGSMAVAGRLSYTGLLFSLLSTDLVFKVDLALPVVGAEHHQISRSLEAVESLELGR